MPQTKDGPWESLECQMKFQAIIKAGTDGGAQIRLHLASSGLDQSDQTVKIKIGGARVHRPHFIQTGMPGWPLARRDGQRTTFR